MVAKNDFEEMKLSKTVSAFLSLPSWSFSAAACNFFINWHFPLQCRMGLDLFTQFFKYVLVLV